MRHRENGNSYREHARELLQRAALERDSGRQRYLTGLARSYEELARQRGEVPELPEPPATAHRADLAAALRAMGYTQAHIGERLGLSPQRVGQILREAARAER
jgi:hypothetical protein